MTDKCTGCDKAATHTVPASWWAPTFTQYYPAQVPCCTDCYELIIYCTNLETAQAEMQCYRLGE